QRTLLVPHTESACGLLSIVLLAAGALGKHIAPQAVERPCGRTAANEWPGPSALVRALRRESRALSRSKIPRVRADVCEEATRLSRARGDKTAPPHPDSMSRLANSPTDRLIVSRYSG